MWETSHRCLTSPGHPALVKNVLKLCRRDPDEAVPRNDGPNVTCEIYTAVPIARPLSGSACPSCGEKRKKSYASS